LAQVVAISTFAILFYYVLTNLAAFRLDYENRRYPRIVPALGLVTCLVLLVFTLFAQTQAWIIGVAGLAAGAVYYFVRKKTYGVRIGNSCQQKLLNCCARGDL